MTDGGLSRFFNHTPALEYLEINNIRRLTLYVL